MSTRRGPDVDGTASERADSASPPDRVASDVARGHPGSLLARAINRVTNTLGIELGDVSFEGIVAKSERRVGCDDWGSDDYLDRLRIALDLLQADGRLSAIGRFGASVIFNWHVANRLRIVDYVKRHPHIRDIEIEKPIFIVGWYRTATTSLHNLLSLDDNHRVPGCWELCYPLPQHPDPVKDRQLRIRRTAQKWRLGELIGPDQKYAHELRADGPEECFFMLANSALFVQQIMGLRGYSYAWRLLETDVSGAYEDLRLQYQILADQRPGNVWVMKCPMHLWYLDELMRVFPDARIIHTHRAAAAAIPSVCSLATIMAQPLAADFDPIQHGAFFHDYCRTGIDRAMDSRTRIPADQILDVRLTDLGRDPVGTVRHVYDRFDLPFGPDMPDRIGAHLAHEAIHAEQLGRRHAYTPEQYGLTAEGLSRDFEDYEAEFLKE